MVKKSYDELTISQILQYIATNNKPENSDIAQALGVLPENISRLSSALAQLYLAYRIQPDPNDQRRVAWLPSLLGIWTILVWLSSETHENQLIEQVARAQASQWPLLAEYSFIKQNHLHRTFQKSLCRHYPINVFRTRELFAKTYRVILNYLQKLDQKKQHPHDNVQYTDINPFIVDEQTLNKIALGFTDLLDSTVIDPSILIQLETLSHNTRLRELIMEEIKTEETKLNLISYMLDSLKEEKEQRPNPIIRRTQSE